jgi:hypothetical protein
MDVIQTRGNDIEKFKNNHQSDKSSRKARGGEQKAPLGEACGEIKQADNPEQTQIPAVRGGLRKVCRREQKCSQTDKRLG